MKEELKRFVICPDCGKPYREHSGYKDFEGAEKREKAEIDLNRELPEEEFKKWLIEKRIHYAKEIHRLHLEIESPLYNINNNGMIILNVWYNYLDIYDQELHILEYGKPKPGLITFKTNYTDNVKSHLLGIRKGLIDGGCINEISEDDFIYLFDEKPITERMKHIEWKESKAGAKRVLIGMVGEKIKNKNYSVANECIKMATDPKAKVFDSNTGISSNPKYKTILTLKI